MTDEPKQPEDELDPVSPDRLQQEDEMRQAGHADPEEARRHDDEGGDE